MAVSQGLRARDYHRPPIRALNGVLAGFNRIGLLSASLDKHDLIAHAQQATGLVDFGDYPEAFRQLDHLLPSLENEARLTPIGRWLARINLLRLLRHRLQLEELLQRHPEILERPLADPIVIVGLARSGTTRLHRMLAADDRFAHLTSWESVNPVPWPESYAARDAGEPDPRMTSIDKALQAVLYMSPQLNAVHPLGTLEVEEEIGLLQHAFASQIFEAMNQVPSFGEYIMQQDQTFAYKYAATLLKVVGWFRREDPNKPWVLKSPQHMQDLDALLRVFPRAKLIFPHRDPLKVMGSTCSMIWNSIVRDTTEVSPEWVGQQWFDKTERMLHKTLELRDNIDPQQQCDVLYADISANWQAAMTQVYAFLGLPFSEQARAGMEQFLARNAQHKHGLHRYALADFGLDEATVDDRLAFYRDRFSIPYETHNPHTNAGNPPQ